MKKLLVLLVMICVATVATAAPAIAADDKANDPKIQVRFLIQPQAQIIQAKKYEAPGTTTPDSNGIGQEFFLRRTRVILAGRVNKWIHFFFETDNPNLGRNGGLANTFTQDGFIDFRFFNELKVAMGMILLPFSRHNRQSAASLMGLDYHGAAYSNFGTSNAWRDYGIEARGMVANFFDYRVGIFRGFRGRAATNDAPRITGRFAFNVFDPESKFFYGGTHLGKSKHLSFGLGFDIQPEGGTRSTGGKTAYWAATADYFLDFPIGTEMAITSTGGVMSYWWGHPRTNPKTSVAVFGEVGFLVYGVQPVAGLEWAMPMDAINHKNQQIQNYRLGLNYFIKGHNATVKIEYANTANSMTGNRGRGPSIDSRRKSVVTFQTQLLF